jgi:hypothetical protein
MHQNIIDRSSPSRKVDISDALQTVETRMILHGGTVHAHVLMNDL